MHPGMESIPEAGHGKTGESARKSHTMIQGVYKDLSYEERLKRGDLLERKQYSEIGFLN